MRDPEAISVEVERARQVAKVLRWLGWLVAAVGAVGVAVYAAFWASGDLSVEQGVSLVLGTMLATVLSGATAYGAGVTRATAATIGIVAWPPQVTMFRSGASTCCSRLTAGTTNGPMAAGVRSMTRPCTNGPRSLTRTTTDRCERRLVTFTIVPNGRERWASVNPPDEACSPFAVRPPEYTEATPDIPPG